MRARRTAMAAATTVLAFSLSGCASLAMLTSGSGHATGWTSHSADGLYSTSLQIEDDTAEEGWTEWSDPWGEGEGYPEDYWEEYTESWETEHPDAVPVLDVTVTGTENDGEDEVEVFANISATTDQGWTVTQTWYSGPTTAGDPLTVFGPPGIEGATEVDVMINAMDMTGGDVVWLGRMSHGDDGWQPVDASPTGDTPTLEIDLSSGETSPVGIDDDPSSSFWTDDAVGYPAWDDEHDGGVPVATVEVVGEAPADLELDVFAGVDGGGEDYLWAQLWWGELTEEGVDIVGPAALPSGSTADELTTLSLVAYTGEGDALACDLPVVITQDSWVLENQEDAGTPVVTLDAENESVLVNGERSRDCS